MIDLNFEGHTAILVMNRPPANAFNAEGLAELTSVVSALNVDARVRAIVVTGAGEKFFSAGADLGVFAGSDQREGVAAFLRKRSPTWKGD